MLECTRVVQERQAAGGLVIAGRGRKSGGVGQGDVGRSMLVELEVDTVVPRNASNALDVFVLLF